MWTEIRRQLDNIYCALADDESKELFDARVQYMVDRDGDAYIDAIFGLNKQYPKNWHCPEIEKVLEDRQKIIIYGCGHDGRITKRVLEICGYSIAYWCDSNNSLQGTYVENIEVIPPETLYRYKDYLVIIGSKRYENAIRGRLFDVDFPTKNVFTFVYKQGVGVYGRQYFDMFMPSEHEVFVDAGAYNGDTLDDFVAWVGDKRYKVYCIEPLADMCEVIRKKKNPNVNVVNCAAWNREGELLFDECARGSSTSRNGTDNMIRGRMIDNIVGDDWVSFIKMDIEGAELKALEGAKETILKCLPKLAICIYHKGEDIYEIGNYILSLKTDYKLYIRHYTTCEWETVLYAVP